MHPYWMGFNIQDLHDSLSYSDIARFLKYAKYSNTAEYIINSLMGNNSHDTVFYVHIKFLKISIKVNTVISNWKHF